MPERFTFISPACMTASRRLSKRSTALDVAATPGSAPAAGEARAAF
jgi:hypothetical protein